MRKKTAPSFFVALLLSVLMFVSIFKTQVSGSVAPTSGTEVGGIISSNTTWTKENSPYIITDTVQIPSSVTLTIEPEVTVTKTTTDDMFLLHGTIRAHGTADSKIVFDGGGITTSAFFRADGSSGEGFLDLNYVVIRNGGSFWWGEVGAHLNLTHSELTNLAYYSYLHYPAKDVYIESNKFVHVGGFSIGHSGSVYVYIRNNLFKEKFANLPPYADFVIQNWASYGESETIVRYNSFLDMTGIVLKLPVGYSSAAMTATENYWETQDTNVIDSMIFDRNDDIRSAGYIGYLPILSEPHPNTLALDVTAPSTNHDYDGLWHNTDFTITLTAIDDLFGVSETYYKINDGSTKNVSAHGQPRITTESANNKLEYWSVDVANNEETHKILPNVKLDKTRPRAHVSFSPNQTVNVFTTVTFDANGSKDNMRIVEYKWDFSDGKKGTGITTTHSYKDAGTYTVTLTVEDAAGNIDTDSVRIIVEARTIQVSRLFIATGVAVAIIGIAVAIVVLWRKRK